LELQEAPDATFALAIARWWLAETTEALRAWERAFVLYRRRGEQAGAVMAAFYLCLAYEMSLGNRSAAGGWLERAARIAGGTGSADLRGWVALARAHLAIDDGQPRKAERWAREAAAVGATEGDVDLELCAFGELGTALVEQGHTAEGAALLDEAMAGALSGEGRDRDAVVLISCRTITAASRCGDVRRVSQWVTAAEDFHRRFGSPHLFATCRARYGAILVATGRWPEAERELSTALEISRNAEDSIRADATATLAELRVGQGRPEEALALLEGYENHPASLLPLAMAHLALGEAEVAAALLRRRLRSVEAGSIEGARLFEALVDAELLSGALSGADRAARRLAEVAESAPSDLMAARASRATGRVALAHGDADLAIERFEGAERLFAAADHRLEAARARILLARALQSAGLADAAIEGHAALTAFDALGAVRDADAAAAFLRSLGVRAGRRPERALGVLSRREREVLLLLSEGLSNPQIADRLFITRKTVEHHVASILTKTGLSGRAEAAVWAAQHLAE
jgi:DNA-binding CsgD family transcriptional regulator